MIEQPIFEIKCPNEHYKIYEDGGIIGFPSKAVIINRIPIKIDQMQAEVEMKRGYLSPGEMPIKEEVIENVINAILNDDVTAREQSAAELKTLLDNHRKK